MNQAHKDKKLQCLRTITEMRLPVALRLSWTRETSFPEDKDRWEESNPAIGQCAVTSLIVQDNLGGKIFKNDQLRHYWNETSSGKIVDLTREQFPDGTKITSDGEAAREEILNGDSAKDALTKERYNELKSLVRKKLKGAKPTIFLLSSNARKEYIVDILETLALPTGSSHHFRYNLKHVDPDLAELIPPEDENSSEYLDGADVLITYLNQTEIAKGEYKWNEFLPIRMGRLMRCYKTGNGPESIVHFYFELKSPVLAKHGFMDNFSRFFVDKYNKALAFMTYQPIEPLVSNETQEGSFESVCSKLQRIGFSFKSPMRPQEYKNPLFISIDALAYRTIFQRFWFVIKIPKILCLRRRHFNPGFWRYHEKGKAARMSTDRTIPSRHTMLTEARTYALKFRTFNVDPNDLYEVKLERSDELFSSPKEYSLEVSSEYNAESWEMVPVYVEQKCRTSLRLTTRNKSNNQQPNPLDLHLILPVEITRRKLPRVTELTSDLFFGLVPAYLAFTKLYDNVKPQPWYIQHWPTVVLVLLGLWFVSKLTYKLMRG